MKKLGLPKKINVVGKVYPIIYVDNLSDADHAKKESVYGSIDLVDRTIRIYRGKRPLEDVLDTLLHEILHGIAVELSIKIKHEDLNTLAVALADTFVRNGWIDLNGWK